MIDQRLEYFRLEYLKYKISRLTMNFSKNLVKEENKYQKMLEKKLKKLEKNLTNFPTNQYHLEMYIPKK